MHLEEIFKADWKRHEVRGVRHADDVRYQRLLSRIMSYLKNLSDSFCFPFLIKLKLVSSEDNSHANEPAACRS